MWWKVGKWNKRKDKAREILNSAISNLELFPKHIVILVIKDRNSVELSDLECYQNLNIGTTHVLNSDMFGEHIPNLGIANLEHGRNSWIWLDVGTTMSLDDKAKRHFLMKFSFNFHYVKKVTKYLPLWALVTRWKVLMNNSTLIGIKKISCWALKCKSY